jgi:hypothetical protein
MIGTATERIETVLTESVTFVPAPAAPSIVTHKLNRTLEFAAQTLAISDRVDGTRRTLENHENFRNPSSQVSIIAQEPVLCECFNKLPLRDTKM